VAMAWGAQVVNSLPEVVTALTPESSSEQTFKYAEDVEVTIGCNATAPTLGMSETALSTASDSAVGRKPSSVRSGSAWPAKDAAPILGMSELSLHEFKAPLADNNGKQRVAFATMLDFDVEGYVVGALMLARSLRTTGSLSVTPTGERPDLVVIIASERTYRPATIARLKSEGFIVFRADNVPSPFPKEKCAHFCDFYRKLRLWQLPYDRIVYLDADMLVRQNVQSLLTVSLGSAWPVAGAVGDCVGRRYVANGGLYVLNPSQGTFQDMQSKVGKIELPLVQHGDPWEYTEQTFLHAYFRSCFFDQECDGSHLVKLDASFNARMMDGSGCDLDNARIWHFAGLPKPWDAENPAERNIPWFDEFKKKRLAWGV